MGRELKRVPMDFAWPLKATWIGYINPYRWNECPGCGGCGLNPETKRLYDTWYDHEGFGVRWRYDYGVGRDGKPADRPPWRIVGECRSWQHDLTQDEVDALAEAGRLMEFTHVPLDDEQREEVRRKVESGGNSWLPRHNGRRPAAEEVNEWSRHGMGHDGINKWICVRVRAERLGIYGKCRVCGGEGAVWFSPEMRAAHEAWEREDPPEGDGYQLWETTSEGSPISPVFASLDALCAWAAGHATVFGDAGATADEWRRMLDDGLVVHREGNAVFL